MEESIDLAVYEKTGVSIDYWNEIGAIYAAWKYDGGVQGARTYMLGLPLRKYAERYEEGRYRAIVDEKNQETVNKIDQLVEELNAWANGDSEDINYVATRYREISMLLYADESVNRWVIDE